MPYLKAKGIKTITGLILTHGDFDHIGGAKAVLENVHVENVYYPEGELEKEIEIELFQQVEDEKNGSRSSRGHDFHSILCSSSNE